jgi:ketosteroid isomerase-like protein
MKNCRLLLAISLLAVAAFGWTSDSPSKAEMEVRGTLTQFLTAFDNLDWDAFRNSFTDDATVFYPRAMPRRASGRDEFEPGFKKVFDQVRGNKKGPPYIHIEPKELKVQMLGDIAIVTFHLDDRPGFLNRRTVVMRTTGSGWKIVHLHASEVAIDTKLQPTSTSP